MTNKQTLAFRRRWFLNFLLVVAFILSIGPIHVVRAGGWSRSMIDVGTRPADQAVFETLELINVGGVDDHVYGLCVFYNIKPRLVALNGTKSSDGEFYPYVVLQVANNERGKWQTVEAPSNPGKISTLTVEAKRPSKSLMVNLDVFRPMIGKYKYGKITLKTGQSTVFKLEKLLPPKEEDAHGNEG